MNLKSFLLASIFVLPMAGCGGGGTAVSPEPLPIVAPVVNGVAYVAGSRGEYAITRVAAGKYSVTNQVNSIVTNVVDATAIGFSEVTINLGIGDKATALGATRLNAIVELYMALMNQVPDADSLAIWIDNIDPLKGGLTMGQAADQLHTLAILAPPVETGYNASMLNAEFVTAVYKNVFGRTALTVADVQAWSSRLDKDELSLSPGISRGALVQEMLAAARSGNGDLATAAVVNLLDNKVTVGRYFAVEQGINFNETPDPSSSSSSRRAQIASKVTATDVAAAKGLIGFSDSAFNLALGG